MDPSAPLDAADVSTQKLFLVLVGFMVLTEVAPIFGLGDFPHRTGWTLATSDLLVASCFLGTFVLYFFLPRRRPEMGMVLTLAVLFEGLMWTHFYPPQLHAIRSLMRVGFGAGMAAVIGFCTRISNTHGVSRRQAAVLLMMGVMDPLFMLFGPWAMHLIVQLNPNVYDLYGYAIDASFGAQFSFIIANFAKNSPVLWNLANLVYVELPVVLVLTRIMGVRHRSRCTNNAQLSFVWLVLLGMILYNVFPMVGTEVLWGTDVFPGPVAPHPLPPHLITAPMEFPRNCMPSLHMAWALTVFFSARALGKRYFWGGVAYLVLMGVATMIMGHYFIDLIVALPFTVACQSLATWKLAGNRRERLQAGLVGMGLVLISLSALRCCPDFLIAHPAVVWGSSMIMVAASLLVERRMREATLRCQAAVHSGGGIAVSVP